MKSHIPLDKLFKYLHIVTANILGRIFMGQVSGYKILF